jgi:DNA polymerase/3'-5' exonuclease PolX
MRKEIPTGVLEMLIVPGLRADKVLKLYEGLGLSSLAELERLPERADCKRLRGLALHCKPRFCAASRCNARRRAAGTYTGRPSF